MESRLFRDSHQCPSWLRQFQSALQRGPHIHFAEFLDGGIEMLHGISLFCGIMLRQKLGQLEARDRPLRAERHSGRDLHCFGIILARFLKPAQEHGQG